MGIMTSVTMERAKVCLGGDDVDGLHWLYPVCDGTVDVPLCTKPDRDMGWIRMGVYVIGPLLAIMTVISLLFFMFVHKHNKKMYRKKLVHIIPQCEKLLNLIGRRFNQPPRSKYEWAIYMCDKYGVDSVREAQLKSHERNTMRKNGDLQNQDDSGKFPTLAVHPEKVKLPPLESERVEEKKTPSPVPRMIGKGPLGVPTRSTFGEPGPSSLSGATSSSVQDRQTEEEFTDIDEVKEWLAEEDLADVAQLIIDHGVQDLTALQNVNPEDITRLSVVKRRKLKKAIDSYDWSETPRSGGGDGKAEVREWLEEEDLSQLADRVLDHGVNNLADLQALDPIVVLSLSEIEQRKLSKAINGYDWSETPRSETTPRKEEEEE